MRVTRLKAQSMLEYSMLIFCACLALVAMSSYLRRAITGGLRENMADLSGHYSPQSASAVITDRASSSDYSITFMQKADLNNDGTVADDEFAAVQRTYSREARNKTEEDNLAGPLADESLFPKK